MVSSLSRISGTACVSWGAVRHHQTHALRFFEDCVLEMDEKGADGLFAVAGDTLARGNCNGSALATAKERGR